MYEKNWRSNQLIETSDQVSLFLISFIFSLLAGWVTVFFSWLISGEYSVLFLKLKIDMRSYELELFSLGFISALLQSIVRMEEMHAGLLSFFGKPVRASITSSSIVFVPVFGGVIGLTLYQLGVSFLYDVWKKIPLYPYTVRAVVTGYTTDRHEVVMKVSGNISIIPSLAYLFGINSEEQVIEFLKSEIASYVLQFINSNTYDQVSRFKGQRGLGPAITGSLEEENGLSSMYGVTADLLIEEARFVEQSTRSSLAHLASADFDNELVQVQANQVESFAKKLGLEPRDAPLLLAALRGTHSSQVLIARNV